MREFGAHVTCVATSTRSVAMISCGVCGSYALGREAGFDLRGDNMAASNKIVCSTLILSLLAVAAIVALSITVAVYNRKILDFMDRHESEWYNMSTTETTTKFWELGNMTDLLNGTLVIERLNSTSALNRTALHKPTGTSESRNEDENHNRAGSVKYTQTSENPGVSDSDEVVANEISTARNRTKRVDSASAS